MKDERNREVCRTSASQLPSSAKGREFQFNHPPSLKLRRDKSDFSKDMADMQDCTDLHRWDEAGIEQKVTKETKREMPVGRVPSRGGPARANVVMNGSVRAQMGTDLLR